MKNNFIAISIFILSIVAILIGVFYPNSTEKTKTKKDKITCAISKKDNYYLLEYESSYDKYSVLDNIYEVFDNKNNMNKIIDKVNCDSSKLDIDFSKNKALIMEVVTNPSVKDIKIDDKSVKAIVSYKYEENNNKYNLLLIPIDKNIENYDIRITPTGEEPVK